MKIGFCMLSWGEPMSEGGQRLMRQAAETGYHGVEIPVVHGERAEFMALARHLDGLGLERAALSVMPHGMNPISTDAAERQAARERIAWCLDCVAELGATLLVGPVHQTLSEFTGLPPSADEYARLRDFHRHAGELAASRGIRIAVEPMNRFEAHLFNTIDQLAAYLKTVDHKAVGAMYDTFHANIEEDDPVAALARHVGTIFHFHVSETTRGVPGDGHVRWPEIYRTLKRGGYDGWITVESFGRVDPHLAAVTRVWRDFAGSPEDVLRRSFTHMSAGWAAA
jgi:D-psicose/D-tagatose/L-ribulose 3-epimerase